MKPQKNQKMQSNGKPLKKKSKILPVINKFMPYILSVFFVITLFSLLNLTGGSNNGLKTFLQGLFSNFASYFVPVFMLYHALMWYYDVKRKICARRVICSFIIVIFVSSMQQVIMAMRDATVLVYSVPSLFDNGKAGIGGGVIGGLIGTLLFNSFGKILALAIVILILAFMFLQMFNITPVSVARSLRGSKKSNKEYVSRQKAKKRIANNMKHKKFNIFDDDDDDEIDADVDVDEESIDDFIGNDKSDFESDNDPAIFSSFGGSAEEFGVQKNPNINSFSSQSYSNPSYSTYESDQTSEFELGFGGRKAEPKNNYDAYERVDDEREFNSYDTKVEPQYDRFDRYNESPNSSNAQPISNNLEDYLSPEVMEKIKPVEKNEELTVEKKSFFGGLLGRKDKQATEDTKREAEQPKKAIKKPKTKYVYPPVDFLTVEKTDTSNDEEVRAELQENARIIVETLNSFNARTRITDITRGPTVTRYELMPEAGVRVRTISGLVDDIALNLASDGLRIECPIPGKSAVGIEVPNRITSIVYLRGLLEDQKFKQAKSKLTCAVGKTISGENYFIDIEKLPHLLVAGATGMGKSVCINSLLVSLLYKATPDEVRLILVDPKKVELSNYNGIPHLLVPVVCESKKAIGTLQWAVAEMERRFETLEGAGVRNIGEFNDKVDAGVIDQEKMARIVIVIDELYDLKMTAPEVEDYIIRLTQKARAAGLHVIVGTQRPSVDVITGVIKANIPSRIAFRVPALVDSRTILDEAGAEKLVSRGDMLIKPVGALKPVRVQGAFITADEIEEVISFLKENSSENYDENVVSEIESNTSKLQKSEKRSDFDGEGADGDSLDEKFYTALEIATDMGKISASLLQRKLGLGFQRASKIIDTMEEMGYVGESNGSKPRDVLITKQDFLELRMRNED